MRGVTSVRREQVVSSWQGRVRLAGMRGISWEQTMGINFDKYDTVTPMSLSLIEISLHSVSRAVHTQD